MFFWYYFTAFKLSRALRVLDSRGSLQEEFFCLVLFCGYLGGDGGWVGGLFSCLLSDAPAVQHISSPPGTLHHTERRPHSPSLESPLPPTPTEPLRWFHSAVRNSSLGKHILFFTIKSRPKMIPRKLLFWLNKLLQFLNWIFHPAEFPYKNTDFKITSTNTALWPKGGLRPTKWETLVSICVKETTVGKHATIWQGPIWA